MLLDGGFIRRKLGTKKTPVDAAGICQAQVIVLVTADSDFIPAMKFARREGAQLFLITLAHGIKEGMREHADLVIDQYPFDPLHRPEPRSEARICGPIPDQHQAV